MEERLTTLLYNAIGFMLETNMQDESFTIEEVCEEIADYLGSTVEELKSLNVLDYDSIIEKNKEA